MNLKIISVLLILLILKNCFNKKENFKSNLNIPAYFINLDRQNDRKEYMNKQFKNNNLNVTRYSAFDKKLLSENKLLEFQKNNTIESAFAVQKQKKEGSLACLLSHLYLWGKIYNQKNDEISLIFEDDCKILPNFNQKLQEAIHNAPEDWDMIWLGYNKIKGQKVSDHYYKPFKGYHWGYNSQHHCYLIKRKAFPKLQKILLPVKKNFNTKDTVLRINFDKFNAYFYKERLAVQDVDEFPTSERTGNKNG